MALAVPAPLQLVDGALDASLPVCPAYNVGHVYADAVVINANDRLSMVVSAPVGRATPHEIADAQLYTFAVNQEASLGCAAAAGMQKKAEVANWML